MMLSQKKVLSNITLNTKMGTRDGVLLEPTHKPKMYTDLVMYLSSLYIVVVYNTKETPIV